jgi:polyketide synthase PksN
MLDTEQLLELTERYLKDLVANTAASLSADFDAAAPFGELGIDSFRILKITKTLEADFGRLPKTLLFENFNIEALTRYFLDKHEQALRARFSAGAPASPPAAAVAAIAPVETPRVRVPSRNAAVRLLYKDLHKYPELQGLVQKLFDSYGNEGGVSRGTGNIAPNLFIGSERRGYFNYGRSNDIILVYAYTGPEEYFPVIAAQMYEYCAERKFQLNVFTDQILDSIGGVPFSATPFGALQRILDIQGFTLEGGPMRRLRYQVSKFDKSGVCSTREYRCGTDPDVDRSIAGIIEQWCAAKTMVNPLIHIVRQEILAGTLHARHRVFLTHVDEVLQNVILISPLSSTHNGYLMDLEFYTRDMPLGGLEFAVVRIIEKLVVEGCNMLSLGGTYGCRLGTSPSADPEIDRVLDDLHKQNIFNDEGNLQFKNKFRPENRIIYLCRPADAGKADNVIDIIMMIADPAKSQTSDEENHNVAPGSPRVSDPADTRGMATSSAVLIAGDERSRVLGRCGFNPLNIPEDQVEFDLKTDSWAQLKTPAVEKHMGYLRSQLQQPVNVEESLRRIFPFTFFVLTDGGRTAEHLLCKAWPKKGIVLQNLLFPTGIYHQIDNGFTPCELPHPQVFQLASNEAYKGNLAWDAVQEQVARNSKEIAFVCVEVSDNAAGGCPVSTQHLRQLKELLAGHSIPLLIDATRILENAQYLIERESEHSGKTIWLAAREILSYADVVVASLAKDFCVNKGGVIATNDGSLLRRLQDLIQQEGGGPGVIDRKLIGLALQNHKQIEARVLRRIATTRSLWKTLEARGIPVVHPSGGHCVLIDVKRIPELKCFQYPVASFLAWMYLNTGIRAGVHSCGMQKGTPLNGLVRLAIPVGLKPKDADEIGSRLVRLFGDKQNIPEVVPDGASSVSRADVHANYTLIRYHRPSAAVVDPAAPDAAQPPALRTALSSSNIEPAQAPPPEPAAASSRRRQPDIAVVGMAGRYPKARNLDELWENLRAGRDCLSDIPPDRLARRVENELTRRYRGGFLADIDKFDSLFFNISPREAEALDPQERLFLEVAWEALEDAGYYPQILARDNAPRNVGVFVGAVWSMYQILGVEEKLAGNDVNPNSFLWSIANRVSYWMNLTGPSLTVDTACSSSLTSLYLACDAIHRGDCSSAIVGGVNLDLHQHKFDINWAGGALSSDGVCRSFGAGANGYVAGEGVGAIFIKPLDKALEDRDNIYGVIKSAVVNHGGRTSGYTVPNPKAQSELVAAALERAGVDARSVGYVEAHGTGTELGDPIEVAGLTSAFEGHAVARGSCAIGSVKTNIGHAEAAAGVVGICKVLLQMKHRRLVPSLHSARLNEHIDFESSPFYVQQRLEEWTQKEIEGIRFPLRAGISSFGAGGANAHIVIEHVALSPGGEAPPSEGHMFPLSARNDEQLRDMAVRLRRHLEKDFIRQDLNDIAFTLQNGRKSFDHRLVVIARTRDELIRRLDLFVQGGKDADVLWGHAKNSEGITKLLSRKEREQFVALLYQSRNPHKLAQMWIEGLLADCHGFAAAIGRRTSLPTYPFADKRHWIGTAKAGRLCAPTPPHPLIDSNESTFQRQLFKKTFREGEFFIREHVVSGVPTLPGAAYLDLARKAGEIATGRKVRKIRNVTWVSPLTVNGTATTDAFIELKPSADSVLFEVFCETADGKKKLYSQGKLLYEAVRDASAREQLEYLDVEAIRARCTKSIAGPEAYSLFASQGMSYGASFQVLQQVLKNQEEVLGVLKIPASRGGDFGDFVLHPCIFDAAMQAGVVAQLDDPSGEMKVPYSIGEVEILHSLTPTCYSYLKKAKGTGSAVSRDDVTIVDEAGKVLARIREAVGVPLSSVHEKPGPVGPVGPKEERPQEEIERLYYAHAWRKSPLTPAQCDGGALLIFDTNDRLSRACATRNIDAVLVMPGDRFQDKGNRTYTINPQDRQDYIRLLDTLGQQNWAAEKICHAWTDPSEPAGEEALARALERGVYSFLALCQALIEEKPKGRVQILYLHHAGQDGAQAHNEAINGFARTLRLENPKFDCKVLEIRQSEPDAGQVLDSVLAELHSTAQDALTVRYEGRERYARVLEKLDVAELEGTRTPGPNLKQQGVYVITGGTGGLGLIFAEFLARQCKARLVLSGRSGLGSASQARLESLRNLGAEVLYVAADVSKSEDVQRLLSETKSRFGSINGIIHAAGLLRDSFLRKKTREEMAAVFAPKVYGTFHLDELTQKENLDFFVLFSSLAAVGGNAGQCDYAFANHYMDSFATRRERMRTSGCRSGRTLSINWSLWADGGMQLDEQTEVFFKKSLGIVPLRTEFGLEAFVNALPLTRSQLAVLEGIPARIELAWGMAKNQVRAPAPAASGIRQQSAPAGEADITGLVIQELSKHVMALLKLSTADLSLDSILTDLGFDSIGLTTFANVINDTYQLEINPVLFFEYPSIQAIAGVLATEHRSAVEKVHGRRTVSMPAESFVAAQTASAQSVVPHFDRDDGADNLFAISKGAAQPVTSPAPVGFSRDMRFVHEPIAIVGIGGVMPQSANLEEFWANLKNARNLVEEIPRDRWIWEDYDGNPAKEANKSNSRWGGFMKEVDKFDALFFGITPREAEMMDPQQRIFLETVWSAIEDSGHKVSDLSGTKTGLFVGVSAKDYIDVLADRESSLDGYSASGNSHSILANRVSFLLNLRGPSAPIDTACSSSLIALHRAIESIHTGSCDMALVGGVQVMLTPIGHVSLSSAGMLSVDGKCKTFDKNANGYVRGEGAGAIFIKTLAKAEKDGNPIYAVIKATAENHGGRVTMLTAPNPKAQAELLVEAYEKARIDPTTVGYIECHGTGTSLGDPIEIRALKKAFADLYAKHGKLPPAAAHCGLGSVKTNIGHLEPAAGVASLLKVLLSMKHKQLPALLHFQEPSPYLDLGGTPFYVVDRTAPWEPVVGPDGAALPRRAGVSSFGWGGANAHVVLEEYVPPKRPALASAAQVFVLSAKSEDRLKAYAALLLAYLSNHEVELADLAYTLQIGRDAMEERLGLIVDSVDQLAQKLRTYLSGATAESEIDSVYRGRVARSRLGDAPQSSVTAHTDRNEHRAANQRLAQLADAWVRGAEVHWSEIHPTGDEGRILCKRISLPTYPFTRERHWIQAAPRHKEKRPPASTPAATVSVLHSPDVGSVLAKPKWVPSRVTSAISPQRNRVQRHLVLLCGPRHLNLERLRGLVPGMDAERLSAFSTANAAQRYSTVALACFERVQAVLKARPKGNVLFQVVVDLKGHEGQDALLAGLSGLIRSARIENPHLIGQVMLTDAGGDERALAGQLLSGRAQPDEPLLKYERNSRSVLRWQAQEGHGSPSTLAFRNQGVYLITGGLGGLGVLFARQIIEQVRDATIVLTGRSEPTPEKLNVLAELCADLSIPADQLVYRSLDLGSLDRVEALITEVVSRHGGLNGVIHSAGMTRDRLIVNKTAGEFASVLEPKVAGTFHLDAATRDVELDFLALFSSVTAALGNAGQADYAAANGFMDQFAHYRNRLLSENKRRGHTLSINWPLWEEGGMQVDAKTKAMLLRTSGMLPMRTNTGMQAFHTSLELKLGQALVMEGQVERLRHLLFPAQPADPAKPREQATAAVGGIRAEKLRELLRADLHSFRAGSI